MRMRSVLPSTDSVHKLYSRTVIGVRTSISSPAPIRISDEALWEAALGGDQSAFSALYRRHAAAARWTAAKICGVEAADDAVQAAFLSLWRNRASFDSSRGSLRSWILGAVRHRAIDSLRDRRRRGVQDHLDADDAPEPVEPTRTDAEVAARELAQAVREAVSALPERQRQVIELAYYDGYSQSEVASQLQIPLGTVKGRTRLAFARLPGRLEQHREPLAEAA